jgi:hypothetical protein
VIGQMVYDVLDDRQKLTFHRLQVSADVWGYMSDYSGGIYSLYSTDGAYMH